MAVALEGYQSTFEMIFNQINFLKLVFPIYQLNLCVNVKLSNFDLILLGIYLIPKR